MPSIATHYYFAKDVLASLDKDIANTFKNEELIYTTFAQSHDFLYYYHFDLKNSKRIKELGSRGHHEKTRDYLINIIKYIKKNKLQSNQQLISYLYGSITHYCLDSTCHPFIFYKTGIYRQSDPPSKKYRGEHNHMEKDLDAIYYEMNEHKKYNHCNINRDIVKNPRFSKELTECITYAYKETYDEDNIGNYFYKSIKQCKLINAVVINDYFGIKRAIYKLVDYLTRHKFGYIQAYSTHILHPDLQFLNLEKKEWNHPSGENVKYHSSFPELYEIALYKARNIIKYVHQVLFNKKGINTLDDIITDIDYATGMLIKDNLRMQYFE